LLANCFKEDATASRILLPNCDDDDDDSFILGILVETTLEDTPFRKDIESID
jgi:hypothetical protein